MRCHKQFTRFWTKKVYDRWYDLVVLEALQNITAEQRVELDKFQKLRRRELLPRGKEQMASDRRESKRNQKIIKLLTDLNKLLKSR